jgi:hypothetical protein
VKLDQDRVYCRDFLLAVLNLQVLHIVIWLYPTVTQVVQRFAEHFSPSTVLPSRFGIRCDVHVLQIQYM